MTEVTKMTEFVPRIVAFCCNYCAYAAADLAGVSRMQYPPQIRIIRVPCSGKVDMTYLLRAFESGADGVIVAGCLEGGCHFVEGNFHEKARVNFARDMLAAVGIDPARLEMFNFSSSMAPRFIEIVNEVTERITKLGPAFPKKVKFTDREGLTKREFLYKMLANLATKTPDKPLIVPEKLKEFGRIEYEAAKCIGCKKCKDKCEEQAIDFQRTFDLSKIVSKKEIAKDEKITKRRLLYMTIANLAVKQPVNSILVPEGLDEFAQMQFVPEKCVACEKCIEVCPEKAIFLVKEIDFPKIIEHVKRSKKP
jgi:F420-non-reducing hydrogenase iron-sulfur subunit